MGSHIKWSLILVENIRCKALVDKRANIMDWISVIDIFRVNIKWGLVGMMGIVKDIPLKLFKAVLNYWIQGHVSVMMSSLEVIIVKVKIISSPTSLSL